jgi:hypothetical protein
MRKFLIVGAAAGLLSGCSALKDEAAAGQAVTHFHQLLDAGQYEAIYAAAAPELRASSPKPNFLRFMDAVHRKLGAVQEAKQQGWRVDYGTGGGTISLSYQTRFARGGGAETFVYRTGPTPLLVGYNINSSDLIVN